MNENINLCEILKDCPKGTKFYSSVFGRVEFKEINDTTILVSSFGNITKRFDSEGRYISGVYCGGECTLFPSADQRNWSKWVCPKPKNPKFDPKTLQPFDRILTIHKHVWVGRIVSHIEEDTIFVTSGGFYDYCVPYNEETKHLVGTSEEAPEYYRYWED